MITRLRARNFQNHDHLDITFDQVTTIVGPNDSGKSAVVRALRFVLLNQPTKSDCFVKAGRKKTWVEVTLASGVKVTRVKGKHVNEYYLGKKKFKSFGRDVPQEIKDALRVEDTNFQGQFDPPFWFTESPGQVSKNLNRIVDLEVIDRALADAATEVKKAKSAYTATKARHQEAKAEAADLSWVGRMRRDYKRLAALTETAERLERKVYRVRNLVRPAKSLHAQVTLLVAVVRDGKNLASLAKKAAEKRKAAEGIKDTIAKVKGIKDPGPPPDVSAVQAARDKGDELAEKCRALEQHIEDATSLNKDVEVARAKVKKAEADLNQTLKGRCPTCGKKAKAKNLLSLRAASATYT